MKTKTTYFWRIEVTASSVPLCIGCPGLRLNYDSELAARMSKVTNADLFIITIPCVKRDFKKFVLVKETTTRKYLKETVDKA